MSDNIAWWFAASDRLPHDDGRRVVLGETLIVEPPLILCQRGLHWCRNPFDALQYARGSLLYQVRPGGEILEPTGEDKGCSTERTALAVRDAAVMLRAFARDEARRVVHLWDAPEIVRQWLDTSDENMRDAAWAAAWAAAWDAARDAARAAARAAARDAARAAARDAAWAAAWDAAWAAAWAAAWDAAWAAAWDAAWAAANQRFSDAVTALFAAQGGEG